MKLKQLEVNQIKSNPFQPRQHFDKEELRELADNIEKHELIQPIVVTPKGAGYMLVAGERRWRAHKLAKKEKVYAIIKNYSSDVGMKRDSLVENEMRENLSNEEFKAFVFSLAKSLGKSYYQNGWIDIPGLTKYVMGPRTNHNSPFRRKLARLIDIEKKATPKVKKLVQEDKLDITTASTIANINDKRTQNSLADLAKHKSNKEIRQEVQHHNFKQQQQEVFEKLKKANKERNKSASEEMWVNRISSKLWSWSDTINYATTTLKITNKKSFWNKFTDKSRKEAIDTLKPFRRYVEQLLRTVDDVMETVGGNKQ